jgi:hypothetical protein
MSENYLMTDAQWSLINSALLTSVGVTSVHAREVHDQMLQAAIVMDDIVDAAEMAEIKPLSSYPEDREKLLSLAEKASHSDDAAAIELADLVKAMLEDEAIY